MIFFDEGEFQLIGNGVITSERSITFGLLCKIENPLAVRSKVFAIGEVMPTYETRYQLNSQFVVASENGNYFPELVISIVHKLSHMHTK